MLHLTCIHQVHNIWKTNKSNLIWWQGRGWPIRTFRILVIITSAWIWPAQRPKRVGENIANNISSSSGTEPTLVDENYAPLNDVFPFPSILDAGYPIFNHQMTSVLWIRKTNQMSLFVSFISLLIVAQHVSGNHVPIIRSWRLHDVIALCWYVPWLQGGCQDRLAGSASMDGFTA